MTNSYTNVGLIEQVDGENSNIWGDYVDTNWDIVTLLVGGISSQSVTSGDVTPANVDGVADAGKNLVFKTSGALTGNRNLILPTKNRLFCVWNTSTGLFTLTVKTAAGTGVVVPQGSKALLICDGTNIVDIGTDVESFSFALSDETTVITTGTKVTYRMPYAFSLLDTRASLTTASSSGLVTVNIKESGTTIFSTELTIDANETTSTTAATPYVFSDTLLADDAEMTFIVDGAGTNAAGLKVSMIGRRTP